MIQDFTLHTHTIGFDGRDTPHDMIMRARELGMTTIGVSNHFIVHPNIAKTKFYPVALARGYDAIYSLSFDEAITKFKLHYMELDKLANKCEMNILRGMEVDFFEYPEWRIGFERALKILKPDYIICASHFIEYDGMLRNVHDFVNTDMINRDKMLGQYWKKLARAAETGMFNWMAHLDLPKKVGVGRENRWIGREHETMQAIAKSKTPIEINTGLYRPECDEPYPSPRILKMAVVENVPVLFSDDAHRAAQIGRHFARAYDLAKLCGVTQFLSCNAAVCSR